MREWIFFSRQMECSSKATLQIRVNGFKIANLVSVDRVTSCHKKCWPKNTIYLGWFYQFHCLFKLQLHFATGMPNFATGLLDFIGFCNEIA